MAKQFCVLTVGRSGSTALMNVLQQFDDIALPAKDIECVDNELLHQQHIQQYQAEYAKLCNLSIDSPEALIAAFYYLHREKAFVGFKSMPNRHNNIAAFVNNPDIQIISLWRNDIASTVASFMKAMDTGSWRRDGANQEDTKWRFDVNKHAQTVRNNLIYVLQSNAILQQAPNAIKLSYEELCSPDFSHAELNAFFGRPIKLSNPKPPTSGEQYVENWLEFVAFIKTTVQALLKKTNAPSPAKATVKNTGKVNETQDLSSIMPDVAKMLQYLESLSNTANQRAQAFADIQALCLFIGYPRSGHSIVGALLDAHPEICIAQELDMTRFLRVGMSRNMIYHLITENSRIFTEQGKKWNTYNYHVPNQWQGKTQTLKVIGDKKGGGFSRALMQSPQLITQIRNTFNVPLKFIHIIRNPYDNVATIAAKHGMNLDAAASLYFTMAATIQQLKTQLSADELCEISHEEFIASPQNTMQKLVSFLGLTATPEYLQACAAIVNKKPHQSRHEASWTDAQKAKMQSTIERIEFLKHYQFDSE